MVMEDHPVYMYIYIYVFCHLLRARVYDFRRVFILIQYTNCSNALIYTKQSHGYYVLPTPCRYYNNIGRYIIMMGCRAISFQSSFSNFYIYCGKNIYVYIIIMEHIIIIFFFNIGQSITCHYIVSSLTKHHSFLEIY